MCMMSVADIIDQHWSPILRRWKRAARKAAATRGLSDLELGHILPELMASLGRRGDRARHQRVSVERYVDARLRYGYVLPEIVDELLLLGPIVTAVCAGLPPNDRPDPAQLAGLFSELTDLVARVTDLFMEHLVGDAQTEKHYVRLLQQIAEEAIEQAPHLQERLTQVLELVVQSLGADAAALVLRDARAERQIVSASIGVAHELVLEHAASLVPPIELGLSATKREVSESLQRSGIQSLLEVGLSLRHGLQGALYVGLATERSFSAREVRRLEALADALSIHLDHARLYAEQRSAIASLETERELRERFVSVLAHDLRGPMSTAKLGATLLARRQRSLEGRALAAKVVRSIDRADGMIIDLLDVTRIRSGHRLPLRIAPCDLVALAGDVVLELNELHAGRIVLHAPVEPLRGMWSAEELRRALWNLVTNALKYGAPDRPVTVAIEQTDEGVRLAVHNHGSYIEPEVRARLFDPFVRTGASDRRGARGWGLGLTLVRGCAEAHGGRVEVESNERTGTTFAIHLPMDARPFQANPAPDRAPDAHRAP
jgi:signal transduction histidine kinase